MRSAICIVAGERAGMPWPRRHRREAALPSPRIRVLQNAIASLKVDTALLIKRLPRRITGIFA